MALPEKVDQKLADRLESDEHCINAIQIMKPGGAGTIATMGFAGVAGAFAAMLYPKGKAVERFSKELEEALSNGA